MEPKFPQPIIPEPSQDFLAEINEKADVLALKEKDERAPVSFEKEIEAIKEKALRENRIKYDSEGKFEYAFAANGNKSGLNERQWLETRTSNFKNFFGDWERYDELKQRKDGVLSEAEAKEFKKLEAETSKIVDNNGEPLIVYHGTQNEFDTFAPDEEKKFKGNYFATELAKIIDYAGLEPVKSDDVARKEIVKELEEIFAKNGENFGEIKKPGHQLVYERHKESWSKRAEEAKEKFKKASFFWMKKKYLQEFKGYSRLAASYQPNIIGGYNKSVKPLVIDNKGPMSPWVPKEEASLYANRDGNWGLFEYDVHYAKQNGYDSVVWLNTADGGGPSGTVLNALDGDQIKSAQKNNGKFSISDSNIYQ